MAVEKSDWSKIRTDDLITIDEASSRPSKTRTGCTSSV
jgi:hypothetical protein